jgi:type I site-specific restriction endonuclease
MLGRATRLRPDLYGPGEDKGFFRIFDAVDHDALNDGQFRAAAGGFRHLNRIFDDQLDQDLVELHDEVWRDAG